MKNNMNYMNYSQQYPNFSPNIISKTQPYSFYNQNYQSQSSNKISYNPNNNPNLISNQNFYQNQNNPIKWRNINKINLSNLKNTRDINTLQSYLDNLICGQITEEDIQSIQENSIIKLIQILQTIADILLNEQAELEKEELKLESENCQIMKEFKEKDRYNLKNKEIIRRLKKEKKRDVGVINTYINVINNLKRGTHYSKESYNITDIDINQKKLNDKNANLYAKNEGGEFTCQYCKNKTFPIEFELNKHLEEVHGIKSPSEMNPGQNQPQEQIQIIKPEVIVNVPDNLYGINNMNNRDNTNNEEILNEMKNMQKQFYQKMEEEKLRQLEENENARKMQQNYFNNNINKLENTFKETVDGFKLMLQQKNNINANNLIESEDDEEEQKKLEEIEELKKQLEAAKRNVEKKNIEYENEVQKHKTITLEITQTKKFIEDDYYNNNKNTINQNSFYENNMMSQSNLNLEFKSKVIPVKNKKTYFNSGNKFVSDHDDTDEELNNNKELLEIANDNYDEIVKKIKQNKYITKPKPEESEKDSDNDSGKIDISNPKKRKLIYDNDKKDNNISLRHKKINEELQKYYNKYTKRDKKFLRNNDIYDYHKETIEETFEPEFQGSLTMKNVINNKTYDTAKDIFPKNLKLNFEFEEDEIKEEGINNLLELTNNLFNGMDIINGQNKFINDYYKSIMEALEFKDIHKTVEKINNKSKKIIIKKDEDENKLDNKIDIVDKKDKNINNIINTNTVINSIAIDKEKDENNNIKDKKEEKNEDNKAEINGGLILSDLVIDNTNDKKDEDKLKNIPKENETKKLDNNINNKETKTDIIDNKITNFKPKIIGTEQKVENAFVLTTDIKENNLNNKQEKNLDVPYTSTITSKIENKDDKNLDVPYTSNIIKKEENKDDKNLDGPYTSTITSKIENKDDKNLDVPYTSNITKKEENKDDKNLDGPYTSTIANNINNPENNNRDKHLDAPFTSTQAKIGTEQNNINNNIENTENLNASNFNNLPTSIKMDYNNDNSLDIPYNSNMAAIPQNENANNLNNKNLNVGYSSAKGPTFINNINENNKVPNVPYTSTMANDNLLGQNIQGNTGLSGQPDNNNINNNEQNKEINPENNQSSKIKESEMVLEKNDENNVTKVENNNTTIIKNSVITNGDNDKSMEFDKLIGKK